MNRAKWTALLLILAILYPVMLSACGGKSAEAITSQPGGGKSATTASATTTSVGSTSVPTTAAVTTTVKIPESADLPQTSDAPLTSDPPETSDISATPDGTDLPEPITTEPSVTTTDKPATTTTKPVTTTPAVTTTTPVSATTTAKPATTTVPATSAPATTEPPLPDTSQPPEGDCDRTVLLYEDVKAMWISQYDMNAIYTADGAQREQADYTALVRSMLDNVKSLGFNTIFLQVRPNADSMYPSDYYPMSKYVVGAYGREVSYDPVAIFVEEAHARDLSVHAWINPLRCMKNTEITSVDARYKIRQWYDDEDLNGKYIVLYNGTYYLNPAYEEVRQLIADGAAELLDRYAFDGLHMDDYFYPTAAASFDAEAYADYLQSGGKSELADFRRAQLDLLVSALYSVTKAECEKLLYGISPAGDIEKVYGTQFADVYKWCASEGYIDYICPQVYFGFEHATLDFVSVCAAYHEIIKIDSVKLIVGLSFGKAMAGYDDWAGDGKYEWRDHKDVMKRSLEYTETLEHCVGISVFCYQYFYDPVTGTAVSETAEEVANFAPVLREFSWKKENE
ncbi:MAG: family 10 glycosylhydrolase [Clostridia bacterium]|nr:family 10 glycosylhydrolase [Clostridia bacterium]